MKHPLNVAITVNVLIDAALSNPLKCRLGADRAGRWPVEESIAPVLEKWYSRLAPQQLKKQPERTFEKLDTKKWWSKSRETRVKTSLLIYSAAVTTFRIHQFKKNWASLNRIKMQKLHFDCSELSKTRFPLWASTIILHPWTRKKRKH